jgi:PAS domain S-box-containing protein
MENLENKILYIDDEHPNVVLFEAIYSQYFHVFTAGSTQEADELIKSNQFKVVISDIHMPKETGLAFFKRVCFPNFEPVLIILTAFVDNSLLMEALNQRRIFKYLTKPWNNTELKLTIEQAIQNFDLSYQNKILDLQIRESEKKFYNVFQCSKDSIIIFDENERILEANIVFLEAMQRNIEEVKEMKITDLLDSESKAIFKERIRLLSGANPTIQEYKINIPFLGMRNIEANSSFIEYKGGNAVLSVLRDITERKMHEQAIFNAVIQAEEKERSRIAKDLHDGLGPILATLNMYLEWLLNQDKVDEHPDILNLSINSLTEAITTLKAISNNLSPHMLEKFGLLSAIGSYVERIKKISKINFIINSNVKERFSPIVEISLYRVATECVNNSLKHSGASDITIELFKSENNLNLILADNGKGFDVKSALESRSGMGLHNIQNRIITLGGKVHIKSTKNIGTEIAVDVTI